MKMLVNARPPRLDIKGAINGPNGPSTRQKPFKPIRKTGEDQRAEVLRHLYKNNQTRRM
jgi:hypothetical protein